ncbi:class I adenylate-forming enzyme family protein [Actinoplanes sp. NPDC049265]|uniref:class I adenylate-forming enzyme family protein n=1 Tax=Actinoplanes sp. NPDC049265 TaxID=3363902 RepID=UPI003710AB0B
MLLQRIGNRGIGLGTLFDRAAARHPATVVVLDHDLDVATGLGRRFTVAEITDLVDDLAARLWAAGVRPAERVVVHKSDGFDILLLAVALARVGAVPVLLSAQLDGATAVELLRRAAPARLITDPGKLAHDLPGEVFTAATAILVTSGRQDRATSLAELAGAPRVPSVPMPPGHPALITHTSGTTGIPKLAVHTGYTLLARYRPQASAAALVRRREPVVMHVSFVHSRAFSATAITMLRGVPLIVLADDDPARVGPLLARMRPGVIEAHPNTFMRWEELADDPRGPLASVKYFSSTFDAIHPRTMRRMLAASRRSNPLFLQLYGQSETGPVVGRSYSRRGLSGDDAGRCVGMPFPGMTGVRVVSRDGRPVTARSPGHIEVRSDGRAVTYLGDDELYRRQCADGWWRMGDLGYLTRWGCLHLLDREIDRIPGFGSTLAVEDALLTRLPDLTEVVILPDRHGHAVPVVCTRDDRPLDPDRWRTAVAGLPAMGVPLHRRLADLPHTATTKVRRTELARLLAERDTTAGEPS